MTKATLCARPRCVTGMPAAAVPPMPALMPGTMRKRTPAAASASASSPPRPNTSGSPPFSRTTRWPSRARRISRSLMRSCGVRRPPARLPTGSSRACGASARISGETSASCSTTSASARACAACSVSRPGIAGPGADQPDGALARRPVEGHASHPLACSSASVSAATSPPVSRRHAVRWSREQREAFRPFRPELGGQPRADARGETGAGAAGGDGQQQIAAADLGDAVEVAELGAVLDIDQHALRPRQRREFGGLVVGQAGDPQGAQRGQIRPPGQERAAARLRRAAPGPGPAGRRTAADARATCPAERQEPPQRGRPPAGDRDRQCRRIERDGNHRRAPIRRKTISPAIENPSQTMARREGFCSGMQDWPENSDIILLAPSRRDITLARSPAKGENTTRRRPRTTNATEIGISVSREAPASRTCRAHGMPTMPQGPAAPSGDNPRLPSVALRGPRPSPC